MMYINEYLKKSYTYKLFYYINAIKKKLIICQIMNTTFSPINFEIN